MCRITLARWSAALIVSFSHVISAGSVTASYPVTERLCDTSFENCRTQIVDLIEKAMKQQKNIQRIPAIVISTPIETDVRASAEAAGCDRFVLLPCLPDQLVSDLPATAHALDSDPGALL